MNDFDIKRDIRQTHIEAELEVAFGHGLDGTVFIRGLTVEGLDQMDALGL